MTLKRTPSRSGAAGGTDMNATYSGLGLRPSAPRSRRHPLYFPQTLTLTAKHGTFVARQRNAGPLRRFSPGVQKKQRRDTAFPSFCDLALEAPYPGGGALGPHPDAADFRRATASPE